MEHRLRYAGDVSKVVYMGLGSNQGDRYENIVAALAHLFRFKGLRLERISPIYESTPVGYTRQPLFYNAAAELSTTNSAKTVLNVFLNIEQDMGRVRTKRWGPRLIDLDLLLYNKSEIHKSNLIVPHPEIMNRRFVLLPLMQLCPKKRVPGTGRTVSEGYHALQDSERVEKVYEPPAIDMIQKRSRCG